MQELDHETKPPASINMDESITSGFAGDYPEEFDQERLTRMFEMFHQHQQNDLAEELQKVLHGYKKVNQKHLSLTVVM